DDAAGPSVSSAIGILVEEDSPKAMKARAEEQIRSAMQQDPLTAGTALVSMLVANDKAPLEARKLAMEVLRELEAPLPKIPNLAEAAKAAFQSKSDGVKVAALPLFAK